LQSGGPPVDWEQLQLFVDGVLESTEAKQVRERIERWQTWYNAHLRLLVALSDDEE